MIDIDYVEATRTVGQGSQFAKQQLLGTLLGLSGSLPEGGKVNLLKDYIAAQVAGAGSIRTRKMFGEYALYCDEKVVALICDDRLFIKPTDAGRSFAGRLEEAPPYPGSKPFLVVEENQWSDVSWMTDLVRITAAELPTPKKKTQKSLSRKPKNQ